MDKTPSVNNIIKPFHEAYRIDTHTIVSGERFLWLVYFICPLMEGLNLLITYL